MDVDARSAMSLPKSFPRQWFEMVEKIFAEKKLKRPRSSGSGATLKTLSPLIKQQVEFDVNSALEDLRSSAVTSASGDKVLTSMVPLLKQQVEAAVISALRLYDLTGYHPASGTSKCTKEALSSALQPVADAPQALAREEQEDGAKLRAIRAQRQALDRKEEQIMSKRQCRFGRHQTSETMSKPCEVRRGTNRSVVSPQQELRIVGEAITLDDE